MEVIYNVKYKFKNNDLKDNNNDDLKKLINIKLLNIIMKLENQDLRLKNS